METIDSVITRFLRKKFLVEGLILGTGDNWSGRRRHYSYQISMHRFSDPKRVKSIARLFSILIGREKKKVLGIESSTIFQDYAYSIKINLLVDFYEESIAKKGISV